MSSPDIRYHVRTKDGQTIHWLEWKHEALELALKEQHMVYEVNLINHRAMLIADYTRG